jgi:CRP/FNR family transcriptional regulator, nitrogen fixation regulation protein
MEMFPTISCLSLTEWFAVVRFCESGTRSVVAFYLPGDFFGWVDPKLSLTIEAATDTEVLFIKRNGLRSLASRDARVANVLLRATTNELARAQEHVLLMSKSAKCRTATFLTDLWVRLGKAKYLDVPMSYQDIADYLGLTIETFSRNITDLERSELITRVAGRRLLLLNRFALGSMMN